MNKPGERRHSIRNRLAGNPGEFQMGNRAFNYVNLVTFALLLYFLVFDIYVGQKLMSCILTGLMAIVAILYYYSRYRKQYRYGVFIYAACSYAVLILNYFINSGINGPTIYLFFLTFHLLIVIGKPGQYTLWITLHLAVLTAIMLIEYLHPELVPMTYKSRTDRFIDIGITIIAAIAFIFLITTYLTRHLNSAKSLAEEKEHAIAKQNAKIIAQNQMLEKVNQEKTKIFSIISHDLRSPLDSIRGYLELISTNQLNETELKTIHEELLNQTKYTSDLLLNLLYWSKSQMQGITVYPVALNLKELVEEVTGNKLPLAARKGIKITHSIKPDIEVIGDKEMVRIILRNLVNNAIKFTKPGGEVYIRVSLRGNEADISIQDNGIGIPKEKQAEIFRLKTGSTYGTNNEKGIGIGLILCHEFIEYMKGKIWFESKEGTGTTFYISLPVARK